ncbi:unnamed protein product [Candida verbasci]|uniref:Uncharacterized protein n=1 Tax=Candida verbasci TaxID=1227364 RepID=A0A9W4TRW1_9ASCO|nr:unnamed protein product [Candida verbasci]
MIYSILIEYWYVTILSLIILKIIIQKLYYIHVANKLGAKPATNQNYDGSLGFRSGYELIKSKPKGTHIELLSSKYENVKIPSVHTYTELIFGLETIFTKDPENIKALLSTQFNDFYLGERLNYFGPLLGKGIFTLDGSGWKHSRQMLRPQFSRNQVGHVKALEPHVQLLKQHIIKNKGSFFDLQELFFRFTIDSATEFLFGESVGSLKDEAIGFNQEGDELNKIPCRKEFAQAFNVSQTYLSNRATLQKLYWLIDSKEFRESNKIVHKFSDYYINKVLNATPEEIEKQSGYVFLYELVKETRDPQTLKDQALNILLAGRDTTAGLLSFAIFELAQHPEMWEKLRKEILEAFGNDVSELITFESLKKCEYLKAVINESLRMYPSVPKNGRVAVKNTTIPRGGGPDGNSPILVKKGTTVIYNINATHFDEVYYGKDAKEFKPERWFEESTRKLGWSYLPFNGGPRICLGQQFALTEASYVIARLVQTCSKLSIKPNSFQYPPRKLSLLTMCLMDPLLVKFEE